MKLNTIAIVLSSIGATRWVSALTAPLKGYGIWIPQWEVEVSPGGSVIALNGTIQEVRSELLLHNPNWDTDYLSNIPEKSSSLNKRAFDVQSFFCRGRWPQCSTQRIREGVDYLRGVNGRPANGPGPGNCGRVSCSYKSAIWWCNDSRGTKTLAGFGSIANGAAFLIGSCDAGGQVSGQVFTTTDWNVIVRRDTDSC